MNKNIKIGLWILGGIFAPPVVGKLISLYWYFQMWIGGLLYDVTKWEEDGSIEIYGLVMVGISIVSVFIYFLAKYEEENGKDIGHDCDICGEDMKVGEGRHFPNKGKDGNCYCVCPTCLPTVDLEKLK